MEGGLEMKNKRRFMQDGGSGWTSEVSPWDLDVKGTISGKTRFGTKSEEKKYLIEDPQREAMNRFKTGAGLVKEVAGLTPAGDTIDAVDFYNAAKNGDGFGMALTGLGFIPIAGNALKKAGSTARKYGKAALSLAAEEASDNAYDIIGKYGNNKYIRPILEKVDDYFDKNPRIDKEAMEFYQSDVVPRAKKYQNIDFKISPEMFEYRYRLLDMDGQFGLNTMRRGFKSGKTYMRIRPKNGTLVHEMRHASQLINKNKPNSYHFYNVLSDMSERKLNSTYMPKNIDDANGYAADIVEKEASNTEARYLLWKELKQKLGRTPSVEELDKFIDNMNGRRLVNKLYYKNAYMDSYIDNMKTVMTDDGAGNFIKSALKYVPAIGGAALVLPYSNSNNENKRRFDYEQ